jgi:galactokinase
MTFSFQKATNHQKAHDREENWNSPQSCVTNFSSTRTHTSTSELSAVIFWSLGSGLAIPITSNIPKHCGAGPSSENHILFHIWVRHIYGIEVARQVFK